MFTFRFLTLFFFQQGPSVKSNKIPPLGSILVTLLQFLSDSWTWYMVFSHLRKRSSSGRPLALIQRRKVAVHPVLCVRMSDE